MKIKRNYLNPFYPYTVECDFAYHISNRDQATTSYYWCLRRDLQTWIDDLRPIKDRLGHRPAIKYKRITGPHPFALVANAGKIQIGSHPPKMKFAKKSDIVFMYLIWYGEASNGAICDS